MIKDDQVEINRLPKKSDFVPYEISFIKSMLGPWPRALEAAGLKPVSKHYIEKKVQGTNNETGKKKNAGYGLLNIHIHLI